MAKRILIVEDEQDIRDAIAMLLTDAGYTVAAVDSGEEALAQLSTTDYDVVLSDIRMPGIDGLELLRRVRDWFPQTTVMIMTAYASVDTAVQALRSGAYDYIIKPIEIEELLNRLRHLFRHREALRANEVLRSRLRDDAAFDAIIGKSPRMQQVFSLIGKVAATRSNVLITGKSGTGKELVARAIHYNSERRDGVFLPINCGAISESLIESELFGHKRGAFTDAFQDKLGVFQLADGGTLFLDEVGEIPLHLQVKLLRALDEREVLPVGGTIAVRVDVRILSATNQDLFARVQEGRFREDLYYRLNVVEIHLPPLSDRREDIPLLVEHFLAKYGGAMGKSVRGVDNAAMRALMAHPWRGGVRELENVIERAVIFCDGDTVTSSELPLALRASGDAVPLPDDLREAIRHYEKKHILEIMQKAQFNKEAAAKVLNIGLSSLYRKIDELGITPEELKGRV
ncbi:MAG: sigma-54-dependent Fis family transcriptional regulator [Ignavibacteriae bacterium]|nr:sigma-54-dependent Fis family transcriptional regulator [Ignavibacteriota bacterium]